MTILTPIIRRSAVPILFTTAAALIFAGAALAQGGKGGKDKTPKPGDDKKEEAPIKINIGNPPKAVDEAISKNADKMKKECQVLSEKIGSEVHGAQGTVIALRLEEPVERVASLTRAAEAMVYEIAPELEVDPVTDLWAKSRGPFNIFYFKTKATFGDALRDFIEKRFPEHKLNNDTTRKRLLEIGRFIYEDPSPLAAGEVANYEESIAHGVGQMMAHYIIRGGPPFKVAKTGDDGKPADSKPANGGYTGPDKAEIEQIKAEPNSWLREGFAMYTSVRFLGKNGVYCVTDSRYIGNVDIANKDLDTAYRLVCLEMAQGEEDKAKDFATIIKTDTNALNYLDLAKSWSFFDWMMHPENRPKLAAVLKGMRNGSFVGSLKRNAGLSMADLEAKWKEYVLKEYGGKKKAGPATDPKGKKPDPKDPKKK
jgi:hypothetical protein